MVLVAGFLTGLASLIPVVVGKIVYIPIVALLGFQAVSTDQDGSLVFVGVVLVAYVLLLDILPQSFLQPYLSGRLILLLFAYLGPILFGWAASSSCRFSSCSFSATNPRGGQSGQASQRDIGTVAGWCTPSKTISGDSIRSELPNLIPILIPIPIPAQIRSRRTKVGLSGIDDQDTSRCALVAVYHFRRLISMAIVDTPIVFVVSLLVGAVGSTSGTRDDGHRQLPKGGGNGPGRSSGRSSRSRLDPAFGPLTALIATLRS